MQELGTLHGKFAYRRRIGCSTRQPKRRSNAALGFTTVRWSSKGGSNSGAVTITKQITGTGGLTKNGTGQLQLYSSTANTYSGGTIMNSGNLRFGNTIADGTSPRFTNPLGTGRVTLNGGTIEMANITAVNPLTVNGGTLYSNGDGQTNHREFAFGLDPTNGFSVNPITQQLAGGVFKYTRTKDSDLIYKVYYSTTLSGWTVDASATQTPAPAVSGVETVTVTLSASAPLNGKLFVRVETSPAP